jgi:hypothetical protein
VCEKYRHDKKPIFAAFIDFRKAYDCINRDLLWECLTSLGLHGRIFDSLREMYSHVNMCVRVGGQVTDCFSSDLGVKQGDPLSPLLFGVFIDRMERFFKDMLPHSCGVQLGHVVLQIMLYADDLILVAESASDLQKMLDLLHVFCQHNELTVNVAKSKAMVFNPQHCGANQHMRVTYDGAVMERVSSFVYLGMTFDEEQGIMHAIQRGVNKARGAMMAMMKRCHELNLHNVRIKCHLFDALIKPVINYGCEIWGPSNMERGKVFMSGMREEVEKMHMGFLRQCLGVRKSTAAAVIMFEMNRMPIALSWLKQLLRFWNKIVTRPEGDIVKIALKGSMALAAKAGVGTCWALQVAKCLDRYQFQLRQHGLQLIDVDSILEAAHSEWWMDLVKDVCALDRDFQGPSAVRSIPDDRRDGFKMFTYFRWFADGANDVSKRFWYWLHDKDRIQTVARFRLGSHDLNIQSGRATRPVTVRSRRRCDMCNDGVCEDEVHFFHECPHYAEIRVVYPNMFDGINFVQGVVDREVCASMNPDGEYVTDFGHFWYGMANYIKRCLDSRNGLVGAL